MSKLHEILIKFIPDPDKTLEELQKLLKNESIYFKRNINTVDENKLTPFGLAFYYHFACLSGYQKILNFLVANGAISLPNTPAYNLVKHIKKQGENDLMTLGNIINGTLVETLSLSPMPTHINVCDGLPSEGSIIKQISVSEFQQQYQVKWCRTVMICKAYVDYMRELTASELKTYPQEIIDQLKNPNDNLVIVNMGKKYGHGTFVTQKIPRRTILLYGGKVCLTAKLSEDTPYAIDITPDKSADKIVDGSHYRNYTTFMQHLPDNISHLSFAFPEISNTVASANVKNSIMEVGSSCIPYVVVKDELLPGEIIGYDYGEQYWMVRNQTPHLFDKKGRTIPAPLYSGDKIYCCFPENNNLRAALPRTELLRRIRDNAMLQIACEGDGPEICTITPQRLLKVLREHGYVPGPHFKKPNALDLEWELRQAANDGDMSLVEYILDWHSLLDYTNGQLRSNQNIQPININAVKNDPASLQRSALHNAAEKGHLYVVYYLVAKGALLNNDRQGKNALNLAEEKGHHEIAQFLRRHFNVKNENNIDLDFAKVKIR